MEPPSRARARCVARALAFRTAEAAWAVTCSVIGQRQHLERRVQRSTTSEHQRVVVVAPHPDDETIGAGGTIALHVAHGDTASVIVVTDGGASRAGGMSRRQMVERREAEVREAAGVLGVARLTCLRYPEGQWAPDQAQSGLQKHVAEADLVYAPTCVDFHPDHVAVAQLVSGVLHPGQVVRGYQVGVPLTPLLVNTVVDIRETARRKACALGVMRSQRAAITPLERLGRYEARLYDVPAAEVFWEMRAEVYAAVVAAGDWRARTCPYRGIRPWPFSDPLAALSGLGARAKLRRLAARV